MGLVPPKHLRPVLGHDRAYAIRYGTRRLLANLDLVIEPEAQRPPG
jgi:hypothetical protein